jgi:hypothetical protein
MIWNAFLLNKSGAAQAFMGNIFAPVELREA